MTDIKRIVRDYKDALSKLERNDKLRINMLTMLASDYAAFAPHIVKSIEESIFEAQDALKLVRLYLVDSIVKNLRSNSTYADNFSDNLVKVFLHVFQRGDEKVRASLFKLRNTWHDVFPRGKLYTLDLEVHMIDPKWPIITSQRNGVANPQQRPVAPPVTIKSEPKPRSPPVTVKTNEAVKRPTTNETSAAKNKIFVNPNFVKQEPQSDQPPEKKRRDKSPQISQPIKNRPLEKKPIERKRDNKSPPQNTSPLQNKAPLRNRAPLQNKTQSQSKIQAPKANLPTAPSLSPQQKKSPIPQSKDEITQVHPQQQASPTYIQPTPQINNEAPRPNLPMMQQHVVEQTQFSSQAQVPTTIASGPLPQAMGFVPPRPFVQPPHIRNDAPRLNLPSNNRIFVEGKAYEVFYLDNIAVIERNGVPHRISFCGPPRDVIVDGIAHRMVFGETKAVTIDGQMHYLRFGAPSRELYMGDFPFKGVFGGPPIAAVINGRRHEIRLCGPPPEVKIEQDPCYELMRHMQNLRQNNTSELSSTKKEDKELKIGDLLAKLQKTGVLDSLNTAIKSTDKGASTSASAPFPARREFTPPIIPSNVKMDKFDVRESPVTPLSQFYMPDLKVRYLSVIRSIHQRRSTCPDCGIYFEDTESVCYRNHLDEHIQNDLNAMATIHPKGKSRQRYLKAEEWVAYSKVAEVQSKPKVMDELDDDSGSENDSDEMDDDDALAS